METSEQKELNEGTFTWQIKIIWQFNLEKAKKVADEYKESLSSRKYFTLLP